MIMSQEQFFKKYGKIKVLNQIKQRHPVINIKKKDANRQLMIKFKYGNLSSIEQKQFHEAIKKLIYKVMHSNNVMMDWEDVYQEIWKKIIKCRHTWNQSKGTMVSTWITIVANSVINTLRQCVNKYNSRYCLYDDINANSDEDSTNSSSQQKYDVVQFSQDEQMMCNDNDQNELWKDKYNDFIETLNDGQKFFMNNIINMQDDFIQTYDHKLKLPYNDLKEKLGYDDVTFNTLIYNIRKKYCKMFNKKFEDNKNNHHYNHNGNEYLF